MGYVHIRPDGSVHADDPFAIHERVMVNGIVQPVVWDAELEDWLMEDPSRIFDVDNHRHATRVYDKTSNLIVATEVSGRGYGLNLLRDFLGGDTTAYPTYVAWGADSTAPTVNDTQLVDEQARTQIVSRTKGDKQIVIAGFMGTSTGNGVSYGEVALVTGPLFTQWRLFSRAVILAIPKTVNVIISLTWQIDFA